MFPPLLHWEPEIGVEVFHPSRLALGSVMLC